MEQQYRFFLYTTLSVSLIFLIFFGKKLNISDDYLYNLITELLGIIITVGLIDTIYNHIQNKKEEAYRNVALKLLRMPIYTYCADWFFIYQDNNFNNINIKERYKTLKEFFHSEDFYNKVKTLDFNKSFTKEITYAKYYCESFEKVNEQFQSILAKYASKISNEDVKLIEHFGGNAYIFRVFKIMLFVSDTKFSKISHGNPKESLKPFVNEFQYLSHNNFKSHFDKLLLLIDNYNSVVEDYNKWDIESLTSLSNIEKENLNPNIEW